MRAEGPEKEQELEARGGGGSSDSPSQLPLGTEHEYGENTEDEEQDGAGCPHEPVHQALLGAELTGFPTVPVRVRGQAAERNRGGRWREGAF